jgi:hypothetical protein
MKGKDPIATYLATIGLTEQLPNTRLLAQRLVTQIHEQIGIYQPARPRGRAAIASRGWAERLTNYEWPARVGFVEASSQVEARRGMAKNRPIF